MTGQIMQIKEVFFPLTEAIDKAARQNVQRDFLKHRIATGVWDDLTEEQQRKYLDEATRVLRDFGKNYVPTYPDNERICVQQNESK